jgi:hypothetical protein
MSLINDIFNSIAFIFVNWLLVHVLWACYSSYGLQSKVLVSSRRSSLLFELATQKGRNVILRWLGRTKFFFSGLLLLLLLRRDDEDSSLHLVTNGYGLFFVPSIKTPFISHDVLFGLWSNTHLSIWLWNWPHSTFTVGTKSGFVDRQRSSL